MSTESSKLLLRAEEAAECLNIGTRTVYELMAAGALRSIHIGRLRRIPYAAVQEFIAQAEQACQGWPA